MSATAFQRMRREAANKKAAQSQNELERENTENKILKDMTIDELKDYAEKNNIDIGKSTSHDGILEKIKKAQVE